MRVSWRLIAGVLIAFAIGLVVFWQLGRNCSVVNWCRISEIVFDAATTAIFTIGLGVLAGYLVDKYYRRRRFQEQEDVLLELAKLRLAGVKLRNEGKKKTLEDDGFKEWDDRINKWKDDLYDKTIEFSPVEGERLKTLDDMPAQVFAVSNSDQVRVLRDVSETLRRLDKLLEQRFRPKQSP